MRTSVDSENLATLEDLAPRNAYARNHTPAIILGLGSAGNDATCEDVAIFEDDVEPRVPQAPVGNRTVDRVTGEWAPSARPSSYELHQAARANRSFMLGQVIITGFAGPAQLRTERTYAADSAGKRGRSATRFAAWMTACCAISA